MSKTLKVFIIVSGSILSLWIIGRLTNALQYFTAPSTANYPTIKVGDHFFASNLKKPQRFDFICYRATTPEFGKHIRIHRLCGLERDTIEIRNGDLYVNNESVDQKLPVAYPYIVSFSDLDKLKAVEAVDESLAQSFTADSVIVYVSQQTIISQSINARRHLLSPDSKDENISGMYSRAWNQDHFGPIVIPSGKYFVLGDNRLGSEDSRYIGFVDKEDYVATALLK